jgi:DNA-binding HxlR family transcriptional regulator
MVTPQLGKRRFFLLRRHTRAVPHRMLVQTPQQLQTDGCVLRTARDIVPPHADYALSPLERETAAHVAALAGWIEGDLPGILSAKAI